jgi:hypothetical protein
MPEDESKGTETQNETENQEKLENLEQENKKETKKEEKGVETEVIRDALRKEVEYSIAEKIRKEEKDKLYPEIEKLKNQMKEKETSLDEAQKALKEYEDKNLTAEEKTNKLLQELVDTNEKLKNQLEDVRAEAEKNIKDMQLATFRERLIASYDGEIVEGLVSGNDEASITASAENAHEKWVEIAERIEKAQTDKTQRTPIGSEIDPATDKKVKGLDLNTIKDIDDLDEWKKVRKDLLAKAGILT